MSQKSFNRALRIVMSDFCISNVLLSEKTGLSQNAITKAKKEQTSIYSKNLEKIVVALGEINKEAEKSFWELASGYEVTIPQ